MTCTHYNFPVPEEKIVRCTVGSLAESTRAAGITKTALIVVGDFLGTQYERKSENRISNE